MKMMSRKQNNQFPFRDLDPMTLILKYDLDMIKMYHHAKEETSMFSPSKVTA